MGLVGILFAIAFIGIVIYYLINRPSSIKSSGSNLPKSEEVLMPFFPFGEPGKFSFETRELNGFNYVWKDGKWELTSK